ncbi:acid protease [Gautieria morchelliformis]|nr:acid protease [Gautieria morchelliformis]
MVALPLLFAFLLSLASLALTNPVVKIRSSGITVPIASRINATGSPNFVKQERQRAQALIQRGKAKAAYKAGLTQDDSISIPVTNTIVTYTIQAFIGSPATAYTLLIDTGSSITWVGAGKNYVATNSSHDTGHSIEVTYGSGAFFGEEYLDTVNLGGGLVIPHQSIGVATFAGGFRGVDGILGIGPIDLTTRTTSSGEQVPTVMDNLARAGTIPANTIGIFYTPPTSTSDTNGELTFGGTDPCKISGRITFVPITAVSPASQYWGIDQTITYGKRRTKILASTAGIVDTGTTLMMIASDAFQAYTHAVGGKLDQTTGLLTIDDPSKLQSLFYRIGHTTFEFTAEGQQWPKALNSHIGGDPHKTYLIVSDLGTESGKGLDFINGYTWLEHFYSVFDTDHQRVGIANLKRRERC